MFGVYIHNTVTKQRVEEDEGKPEGKLKQVENSNTCKQNDRVLYSSV